MNGWIIYSRKDFEKNQRFIDLLRESFEPYDIQLELVVLEQGIPKKIPDFAVNRSRDGKVANYLEKKGVRVFNNSQVTKIANDKEKTYRFLKGSVPYMAVEGIQTPPDGLQYPYVIKSCFGHGGSQVFLVHNKEEEVQVLRRLKGEKYLKQKLASDIGKDVRVYIIGNKIIAAMLRTSTESFKSNYTLGGSARQYQLSTEEIHMVNTILEKMPMDYGGIDFIFHQGKPVFNEIEDAVGARMLYENTDIHSIKLFAEYIVEQLTAN